MSVCENWNICKAVDCRNPIISIVIFALIEIGLFFLFHNVSQQRSKNSSFLQVLLKAETDGMKIRKWKHESGKTQVNALKRTE